MGKIILHEFNKKPNPTLLVDGTLKHPQKTHLISEKLTFTKKKKGLYSFFDHNLIGGAW